jgi:hypothetical protein
MTMVTSHGEFITKIPTEAARDLMSRLLPSSLSPYASDAEFEQLWRHATGCAAQLPDEVRVALENFRHRGNAHGALLLRGLPIDDGALGPTPENWDGVCNTKPSWETEAYLLAVASVLGEVFSFERQHGGQLVQNMVPVAEDAYTQKGTGSKVFLEWHTEDAYDRLRAEFILILCLRSDPSARTALVHAADIDVSHEHRECLSQPRFHIGVDPASGGSGRPEDGPLIPLLTYGPDGDVTIRLDTDQVAPVEGDAEAARALEALRRAIPAAAQYVTLDSGDLLIIDNRRTLHARTAYEPRFDGTDRWLQRVSVTTDLARSAGVRTRRSRVIDLEARSFG